MSVTIFLDDDEITGESYAVDIVRGRSLEGEVFSPGGGTVRVRNYAANFNPDYISTTARLLLESGDYLLLESGDKLLLESGNGSGVGAYGAIVLGRKLTIKDNATTVFTGYVEDFDYEYDVSNRSEAVLVCRDALATLAATSVDEWTTTASQTTGTRIAALLDLDSVGFPSGASFRDLDAGTQPMSSELVAGGTNALQELQRIGTAESGRTFIDATGKLVHQDRYAAFSTVASATFADDGSALPFSNISVRYGTELLNFRFTVTRSYLSGTTNTAGEPQTDEDASLIATFPNLGVRQRSLTNMPLDSDFHSLGLAKFRMERQTPYKAVISGLTVPLGRLSSSDRTTVCGLDIGDVVNVQFTPYGSTGPVNQTLVIDGVSYSARASNVSGVTVEGFMSFQLSDATDPDYFTVGTDAVDGPKLVAP